MLHPQIYSTWCFFLVKIFHRIFKKLAANGLIFRGNIVQVCFGFVIIGLPSRFIHEHNLYHMQPIRINLPPLMRRLLEREILKPPSAYWPFLRFVHQRGPESVIKAMSNQLQKCDASRSITDVAPASFTARSLPLISRLHILRL